MPRTGIIREYSQTWPVGDFDPLLRLEKNIRPKIVSELLVHSTVTLTLNTYSHMINPMSGVAADAMDERVGQL